MITCNIVCHSNSLHLSQIFTGFTSLHRTGEIRLTQECKKQNHFDLRKPQHLRDAKDTHLLVTVNHRIKLYYDCHDSYEIDEAIASEVDCYFKRSYQPSRVPDSLKAKVFSLGLNYPLYSAESDTLEQERRSAFEQGWSNAEPLFRPMVENMHSAPTSLQDPGVLFITRAWDPADNPDRSDEKMAERIQINETRARCVELLRQEFGDFFLGGFLHTDYAVRNYGQALLQDNGISPKANYTGLLKRYPVCVATTGLHESIAWKMGEYVAFARAIVSERLNFQLPGDFTAGENYLEFDEPKQCVAAVHKLLSDAGLRYGMMKRNYKYYLTYLRPDALIRRTLDIGLSGRS
ncbi:MAG TPA: hypothetical protein VN920_12745 [Pyrinomonadaceae bacterium]|nr:hypothetical protein [Pyrinomonadaceae bacterium]